MTNNPASPDPLTEVTNALRRAQTEVGERLAELGAAREALARARLEAETIRLHHDEARRGLRRRHDELELVSAEVSRLQNEVARIRDEAAGLRKEIARLEDEAAHLREKIEQSHGETLRLRGEEARLHDELKKLRHEMQTALTKARAEYAASQAENASLAQHLTDAWAHHTALERRITEILNSSSWKMSAPIRFAGRNVGRIRRILYWTATLQLAARLKERAARRA